MITKLKLLSNHISQKNFEIKVSQGRKLQTRLLVNRPNISETRNNKGLISRIFTEFLV